MISCICCWKEFCLVTARYYFATASLIVFFTVKYLNEQIKMFKYGYSEKVNAPRPIDGERLSSDDNKFVQSGKFDLVYMYINETSVGSSLVTNPEPICKG